MKFVKVMAGWYRSENGNIEISNYHGCWEVKATEMNGKRAYIGYAYSFNEAKKIANNY
jgi:hypothetical protein